MSVRHLFVNDYEVTRNLGLCREVHQPVKHQGNPVLRPDAAWEVRASIYGTTIYDSSERLFKRWYLTSPARNNQRIAVRGQAVPGNVTLVGYATSEDGIHWKKPILGQVSIDGSTHNNIVDIGRLNSEGVSVLCEPDDPDPSKRYKAFYWEHGTGELIQREDGLVLFGAGEGDGMWVSLSPDGIQWTNYENNPVIAMASDTDQTVVRDEKLGKYVAFGRFGAGGRKIARAESDDFLHWSEPKLVFECDEMDEPGTQFYGMPLDIYEGLYIGTPWIYRQEVDGTIDTQLACSRDGIHWQRVGACETFLPLGQAMSWEDGMVRIGKRFVVLGEKLYLFYGGVQGPHTGPKFPKVERKSEAAIGLCTLRRDGFVSLNAGSEWGTALTRPINLEGGSLHLNVDAKGGQAVVALCDSCGVPLDGFERSAPIESDQLDVEAAWPEKDISALSGQEARLRISLRQAKIYSFWFEGK